MTAPSHDPDAPTPDPTPDATPDAAVDAAPQEADAMLRRLVRDVAAHEVDPPAPRRDDADAGTDT